MIGLATDTQRDLLGLDEVADVHAIGQHGARSQARERADLRGALGNHALQVAVRTHFGARPKVDVLQTVERTDGDAVAEHHVALEHDIDVDQHVAAHGDSAADVEPGRIAHARPLCAQGPYRTTLPGALQLRELPGVVCPFGLLRVGHQRHFGRRVFMGGNAKTSVR